MKGGVTLVLNCLRSGGAEKQLLWISANVVALGYSCSIFELVAGDRNERIEDMIRAAIGNGVMVVRAPANSGILHGAWRFRAHLAEFRPDLLWSWGLRADTLCLFNRLGGAGRKWLTSIRCSMPQIGWRHKGLLRVFARNCDAMVSNTHAGLVTTGVSNYQGLRKWVLPNVVVRSLVDEVILLAEPPDRLVIVMLGNIKIQHKGYDLVAQLASLLHDRAISFELRIAGRPDELEKLQSSIHLRKVQSVVRFYGEVSHPEEFLREGHLYLLLSRFEGMPNTLLEALNVGLPAIATDVGDLRVLKDQGAPFDLIPTENVGAAAEAVEKAVAHWADTRMAAARGRGWVQENFSEEACRAVLRKILDEVLNL